MKRPRSFFRGDIRRGTVGLAGPWLSVFSCTRKVYRLQPEAARAVPLHLLQECSARDFSRFRRVGTRRSCRAAGARASPLNRSRRRARHAFSVRRDRPGPRAWAVSWAGPPEIALAARSEHCTPASAEILIPKPISRPRALPRPLRQPTTAQSGRPDHNRARWIVGRGRSMPPHVGGSWAERPEGSLTPPPVATGHMIPQAHLQSQILPSQGTPSPSQQPATLLSGRQDLNLRPPGPQPERRGVSWPK